MTRLKYVALLVTVAVADVRAQSCATAPARASWLLAQQEALTDKPGSWSNDSLRSALMAAVPGTRLEPQMGWQLKIDSVVPHSQRATIDYLKQLGATRGSVWPLRSVVGAGGVRAVYYLAQRDTTLLRSALKRMMEGGPDEGIKPDIAILEDQARLLSKRKQLYGTQLVYGQNGMLVPLAIEDSAHVDLRREAAMLPPLAWSVCNANARLIRK